MIKHHKGCHNNYVAIFQILHEAYIDHSLISTGVGLAFITTYRTIIVNETIQSYDKGYTVHIKMPVHGDVIPAASLLALYAWLVCLSKVQNYNTSV